MREPPRDANPEHLWQPFRQRLDRVLAAMKLKGYDPVIFEGLRSHERQKWLYGIGRTHQKKRRPVTWTMKSRHLVGKAADVISKKRWWGWPEFYDALKLCGKPENLHTLTGKEDCHIEWRG